MKVIRALLALILGTCPLALAQFTSTTNIGLEIPANGSTNWNLPLNYNFNRLDLLLSGSLPLPAMHITNNLTVDGTITAGAFTGVSGGTFPTIFGPINAGHCASWTSGNTVGDSGAPCGTISMSGSAGLFYATPSLTSGPGALRAISYSDLPLATNTQVGALRPDGTSCTVSGGVLTCSAGTGSPGGSPFSLQYNSSGVFAGASFNGLAKLSTTAAPTAAAAADVIGLWTGTCDSSHILNGVGTCIPAALTGQTTGNLPLATGPSNSTQSSHFFENSSTSGVLDSGFLSQKSTVNCKNRGVTFTQYACDEFDFYDNGSTTGTTPRNLTGANFTGQFYGPGGWAGSEGRTSTLFGNSNNGAFVTPGIKITQASNMNHFGIGDAQGFQISEAMHGGVAYQSDQGNQLIYGWVGEQGHWAGVVASGGTSTNPKVTSNNAHSWCTSQQNQTCTVSPGSVMLDRSVVQASGNITACSGTGPVGWLGSCTSSVALTATTAWGTAINVNLAPSATWDAPVAQTFTIGANGGSGSGTFAAGDHACVIGNEFFEQRVITGVSGSAGAQTITIPLSQPEGSVFIAKGDCGYLVQDADQPHDIEASIPAVSIDGTHLLVSYPAFSTMNAWSGQATGTSWSTVNGDANSGFHLYAGARIDRVDTTRPDYSPFADDAITITLEPNSAFNVGDNICSPDFPGQKVDGLELTAAQDYPSNSSGQLTGIRVHIGGHGANSAAAAMRFYNDEAIGSYAPWGGPLAEPNMMTQEGAGGFGNLLSANYTPLYSAFQFNNHQPGQTSYYIWNDPSWGKMWLQNGSGFNFDQDLHGGSYYSSGKGAFPLGLDTGESNGYGLKYNFGNGTTAPVYVAPCYTQGNINDHLCVTSLSESRVAGGGDYYAAPNKTLEAGTFIGNISSASVAVQTADAGNGFYAPEYLFTPSSTTGSHSGFFFGRAFSNFDSAYLTFWNSGGAGSSANKISLGFFGANDLLTVDGSGNANVTGNLSASSFQAGTGTPTVYITSPSTGLVKIGSTSGGSDATVQAGSFYAQGGVIDGRSTVTTSTSTAVTIDGTYGEEWTFFNGTGSSQVTFTLPPAVAGMKRCIGTTNNTVPLKLATSGTGQFIYFNGSVTTSGGYVNTTSLGAGTCVVGIDSSNWMLYPSTGTWTVN